MAAGEDYDGAMSSSDQVKKVPAIRRAGRTAATLVLGGVLAAGVLGAYLLVHKNAGLNQAWQDGVVLLEEISKNGLDSYLGRTPRRQYFLLEENGQTMGFAVAVLEPKLEEGDRLVYLGRYLFYQTGGEERDAKEQESAFRVANDLKNFEFNTLYRDAGMLEQIAYREGELHVRLRDSLGHQKQLTVPRREDSILVCPGLEDVITSIALSRDLPHGVSFDMPSIYRELGKTSQIIFQRCWATRSSEASPEMITSDSGRAAKARWYVYDVLENTQQLYFDDNHQLLWQRDMIDQPRDRRAVTREELLQKVPDAQRVLRRWLDSREDILEKEQPPARPGDYL